MGVQPVGLIWQGQPSAHRAEQVDVSSPAPHCRQPPKRMSERLHFGGWMDCRAWGEVGFVISLHTVGSLSLQDAVITKDYI